VDAVVVGAEDALSGVDAAGVGALVEVVLVAVGVGVEVVLALGEVGALVEGELALGEVGALVEVVFVTVGEAGVGTLVEVVLVTVGVGALVEVMLVTGRSDSGSVDDVVSVGIDTEWGREGAGGINGIGDISTFVASEVSS
jgi:hypothetical protein